MGVAISCILCYNVYENTMSMLLSPKEKPRSCSSGVSITYRGFYLPFLCCLSLRNKVGMMKQRKSAKRPPRTETKKSHNMSILPVTSFLLL